MNDLVSVIIPVYNSETTIHQTLESIGKQTYQHIEIIAYDDASCDSSLSILHSAAEKYDFPIKVLSGKENKGVSFARNECMKISSGRYIAFCDSDDIWFPEKIDIQIDAMINSGFSCCHSAIYICDNNMNILSNEETKPRVRLSDQKFRNNIILSTGIYDRKNIGIFYFEENLPHEDFQMWNELLKNHDSIGIVEPQVCYRLRSDSLSSKKHNVWIWFLKISYRNFGLLQAFYGFPFYFYYGLRRLWRIQKLKL